MGANINRSHERALIRFRMNSVTKELRPNRCSTRLDWLALLHSDGVVLMVLSNMVNDTVEGYCWRFKLMSGQCGMIRQLSNLDHASFKRGNG